MPKTPQALLTIPPAATQALRKLGENLSIARSRRRESQRAWATRLGVSVPTLIRMERGDPGVGAGIYVTALWLMGTVSGLPGTGGAGRRSRGARERCPSRGGAARSPLGCLRRSTPGTQVDQARTATVSYTPADRLHLWLVTQPQQPVLIGALNLVRSNQGVSLRYAQPWLQSGFPLSEDLPLIDEEFLPADKATAVGAVDDARPDRWGEQVIRFIDKPSRLSLLEFLYFAGDDRFGALGVSTSADAYLPRKLGPLPTVADADQLQEIVRKVLANEPVPAAQQRLLSPGVSFGGARPKALINIDGEQWVIKFSAGDPADVPLIEHATMTLASKARIKAAQTQAVRLTDGHAVAIRRFDRRAGARVTA